MITEKLDLPISLFVQSLPHSWFSVLLAQISWWGEPEHFIVILALVGAGLFILKKTFDSIILIVATTASALFGSLLKDIIGRPRPTVSLVRVDTYTIENSMPSNHVLVFTVFFGLLIINIYKSKINKTLKAVLILMLALLIFLVSVSRIYLGAHWFTDCLASYLLGYLIIMIIRKTQKI